MVLSTIVSWMRESFLIHVLSVFRFSKELSIPSLQYHLKNWWYQIYKRSVLYCFWKFQNILYTEQVSRLGVHPDSICRLLLFWIEKNLSNQYGSSEYWTLCPLSDLLQLQKSINSLSDIFKIIQNRILFAKQRRNLVLMKRKILLSS